MNPASSAKFVKTPLQALSLLIISLLLLLGTFNLYAAGTNSIEAKTLGLSKTNVNDSPAPENFNYPESFPGSGIVLPRSYAGAPPQIPHNIESFIPVTANNNMCKRCHLLPDKIGTKTKGQPTPIPASHYIDQRNAPGKVGKELVGARTVCTQCHVPQANVKPLVENTFSAK